MRRSSFALLLAGLLGGLAGYGLPRVAPSAAAEAPKKDESKKEEPKKDEPKNTCSCEKLVCTKSDGMRGMVGPCTAKCSEAQTPKCECGACGEDGAIEKRSSCQCKDS
jgi:hypothetical protein